MKSIGAKIDQIEGLLGTTDLSEWEDDFVTNVVKKTHGGEVTTGLSEKQIEIIDRIYKKHFGD